MAAVCAPALEARELRWGMYTSVATGTINLGALSLASFLQLDGAVAVPVITFVMSLVSHFLDVLLAKKCFRGFGAAGGLAVLGFTGPDLRARLRWYGRSLLSMSFVRYLVVTALDTMNISMLSALASERLDEADVLRGWTLRDPVVVMLLTAVTFLLYSNIARFAWAYDTDPDPLLTIGIGAWTAATLVQYLRSPE